MVKLQKLVPRVDLGDQVEVEGKIIDKLRNKKIYISPLINQLGLFVQPIQE